MTPQYPREENPFKSIVDGARYLVVRVGPRCPMKEGDIVRALPSWGFDFWTGETTSQDFSIESGYPDRRFVTLRPGPDFGATLRRLP